LSSTVSLNQTARFSSIHRLICRRVASESRFMLWSRLKGEWIAYPTGHGWITVFPHRSIYRIPENRNRFNPEPRARGFRNRLNGAR
jgi:hypothetical protein